MGLLLPVDDTERKLNAQLKPHLHSIHTWIKKDDSVTTKNVDVVNTLLDDMCKQMKRKDPLFGQLFNRLVPTGSYYDGLRTKRADEFDINLVLLLPFLKGEFTTQNVFTMQILRTPAVEGGHGHSFWVCAPNDVNPTLQVPHELPGHVGYQVSRVAVGRLLRQGNPAWVPQLLKWIDGANMLHPSRVKSWLQSVIDRTLPTYVTPSGSCADVTKIRLGGSGPARTFHVELINGGKIDVNLVPVIEIRYPTWPDGIKKADWMTRMSTVDHNWLLVPKSPTPNSDQWRIHFLYLEKRLIASYGCVKPLIRVLKTLRDSYNWNLSSYSLKTFVMSQLVANYDEQCWLPKNQGILFIKVLERLGLALKQPGPGIPFLFHPEVDLTEKVKRVTRDNIGNRIERIVRKLRMSPDECIKLILNNEPITEVL
ncbi:unnamed protein product, partial [Ixodes hexagonus]